MLSRPSDVTRMVNNLIIILSAMVAISGLPAEASADPVAFASSSAVCTGYGTTVDFPVVSTHHSDAIYRLTSTGASGSASDDAGLPLYAFHSGDQTWGDANAINAGTAPSLSFDCTGGSISLDLYDRPHPPTTISGVSSGTGTYSEVPFSVVHSGQYVVDVALDQGALRLTNGYSDSPDLTIARSGEYSLGSLDGTEVPAGNWDFSVAGMDGPTAHWSMTIRELPVQISGLAFPNQYAARGTPITAPFSVSGDTTIDAYVRNAAGQAVDQLGSFIAHEGNSSITWDARGNGGAALPDGTYWLHLDSTDPNGHATSAETSVFVDGTPPAVVMTSPATIRPIQSVSFQITDTGSGTAGASAYIDGSFYASELPSSGRWILSPEFDSWNLGRHSWEIQANDRVGNKSDIKGSFTAANPTPPPPPPPPPKVYVETNYTRTAQFQPVTIHEGRVRYDAKLRWSAWGSGTATGKGVAHLWLSGKHGRYVTRSVVVHLQSIRTVRGHRLYTAMWEKYSGKRVAGQAPPGRWTNYSRYLYRG